MPREIHLEAPGSDSARKLEKNREKLVRIAELMIRNGLTLRGAAQALDPPLILTAEEAVSLQNRKSFQNIIWAERHKFYRQLEREPTRDRKAAIGMLWLAAHKLAEGGSWDKVGDAIFKLARIENWIQGEQQVSVFAELKPKEIEALKKRIGQSPFGCEASGLRRSRGGLDDKSFLCRGSNRANGTAGVGDWDF